MMIATGLLPGTLHEPLLAGGLLIAMALAVATVATASLVRRDRARHGPTSRRMCRSLRITWAERRVLGRVARNARAPGVGSLLVSRGFFEAAAALYQGTPDDHPTLTSVRRKVFD